jgi:hypothetical protein
LRFAADPESGGVLIFNTLMWTYVHLRGRHHWTAEAAKSQLTDLVLSGVASKRPAPGDY